MFSIKSEKLPNLKKEIPTKVQKAYRTHNQDSEGKVNNAEYHRSESNIIVKGNLHRLILQGRKQTYSYYRYKMRIKISPNINLKQI